MKKYKSQVLLLIVAMLISSCEVFQPCLNGDGNVVTEERLGTNFTGVQAEGEFKVRIEPGATASVMVTTDENLQPKIETTVRDGRLIIRSDQEGCISYSTQTEVVVKCPVLTYVNQSGSGPVEVFGFSSEFMNVIQAGSGALMFFDLSVATDIDLSLIGSGNIGLDGRAAEIHMTSSGSGIIEAQNFRVFNSKVYLSGSGNIHTYVYDTLLVTLPGSGNVYYYGNPDVVMEHRTGSGQVINRSSSN
jgi:hypothetical protein